MAPADGCLLASVIVPVRNGGDDLRELLPMLAAQTIPRERFEVVIGDDGSTDGSTDGVATRDGWVRVAAGPPRSSYAARNRAASLARAPVLAFCDADCRPEPWWLGAGLAALEEADLAAGLIRFSAPAHRTVWTLLDMETFKDHERQVKLANAETANLFVRRDIFERLNGFDESLPEHGDFDFANRAVARGARLVFAPAAELRHPTRNAARPFLRTVWIMHRWYAARETRAGRRPDRLKIRWWLPLAQPVWSRRSVGRPLLLDANRLSASGVRPTRMEHLLAALIMYLVLPYVAAAAQVSGWRVGRRLR
jgi:GT2 family glycosyltransferase